MPPDSELSFLVGAAFAVYMFKNKELYVSKLPTTLIFKHMHGSLVSKLLCPVPAAVTCLADGDTNCFVSAVQDVSGVGW